LKKDAAVLENHDFRKTQGPNYTFEEVRTDRKGNDYRLHVTVHGSGHPKTTWKKFQIKKLPADEGDDNHLDYMEVDPEGVILKEARDKDFAGVALLMLKPVIHDLD
jgi:hypothetical protein